MALLRTRRANKAPGNDSIPNNFLKIIGKLIAVAVTVIYHGVLKNKILSGEVSTRSYDNNKKT